VLKSHREHGRVSHGGAAHEAGLAGAQGLGCMGMSAYYGPPKPEPDMIALIHHAVSAGVTLLDTSDVYGPHTNELLLGRALQAGGGVREKVQLATKFGVLTDADGNWGGAAATRRTCAPRARAASSALASTASTSTTSIALTTGCPSRSR